jgi:hypothetical protein
MIEVENKYDFTVEEMTDILEQTPIAVDGRSEQMAKYIIQALNTNRIIKRFHGEIEDNPNAENRTVYHRDAPYHLTVTRNKDGKTLFESDTRTIAFYAYDPLSGMPHKGIVSEQKPNPTDIANVCELLGDIRSWGTFQ